MKSTKTEPKNHQEVFEALVKDPAVRRAVTRESHALFFSLYLRHYIKYPMAEFQKDILRTTEDRMNMLACIVAFRGSAKSTLVTLSYSLWSILGIQQKKFVLIICQTQALARQHMVNLRHELEQNALLKSDLGPFREEPGEWAMSSLVFKNKGARIMVASFDQSIRGVRHMEHRPDLIILDDIEDLGSTRTMEGRNKTFDWFTREIVPLGDIGTRVILVGNLLHEDSLMMRLRRKIEDNELAGTFQWSPLLTENDKCLWPEKFDTPGKIETLRQSVANELAWQQEYLLKIISDSTRVVWPEWIQYADESEQTDEKCKSTVIGVDLAISQRDTADYNAMVVARVYGRKENLRIYIQPNPVNARMTFPETKEHLECLAAAYESDRKPLLLIEDVGYQAAMIQEMKRRGYRVEGVKLNGTDKRSRLALISHLIKDGTIRFPKKGAELLIAQILGLGIERHDDLVDAFVHAVTHIKANDRPSPSIEWVGGVRKDHRQWPLSSIRFPEKW